MDKKLFLMLVFGLVCRAGYVKDKASEVCMEVAPQAKPSNELPPRSGLPSYQDGGIHAVDIESWATSDGHHPASCAANCIWTGAKCICKQDPRAAKKP